MWKVNVGKMIQYSTRLVGAAGAAIALFLLLAAGTAAGVVSLPMGSPSAAATITHGTPAATAEAPVDTPAPAAEAEAPPDTAPATAAPSATAPRPTATVAPEPEPEPAPVAAAAPAPATTATPKTAARPNVSSAQVQAAVGQLRARNALFNVTEDQARQFGDMVCDAFDGGSSYSQVRAQVMQAVSGHPLLPVTTADADFAIRTAVNLFCPSYTSKLA